MDALAQMLDDDAFDDRDGMTGLEIELNLVDDDGRPAMRNAEVLGYIADPAFQTELGQFNLELNEPPRPIADLGSYQLDILDRLRRAAERAAKVDTGLVLIGMLPTLTPGHLVLE